MSVNIVQQLLQTSYNPKFKRITRTDLFLGTARLLSYRGTCNRGSAGAVIVKNNRIISVGYTGSPPGMDHCVEVCCDIDRQFGGCIRTQHGEANAIAWAAREGLSIKGADMYCTIAPCLSCAKLIAMAGIETVTYLENYRDISGLQYLIEAGVIVLDMG